MGRYFDADDLIMGILAVSFSALLFALAYGVIVAVRNGACL